MPAANRLVGLETGVPNSKISVQVGAGLALTADVLSATGGGNALDGLMFAQNGLLEVQVRVDNTIVMNGSGTILAVRGFRETAGSSGTTKVDLNKNGTTVYTTQANRPAFAAASGNNLKVSAALPNVITFVGGDEFSIDVDEVEAGNPEELAISLWVQYDVTPAEGLVFAQNGLLEVLTRVDNTIVMQQAGTIQAVRGFRETAGAAGTTVVDLNKNGTTVYTTQANRPSFAAASGNNLKILATLPDVISFVAGDDFSIDVDSVESGSPEELAISLWVKYS